MDSAIRNTINKVLAHEAPVVFGTVAEDLEPSLSELKSFGDPAVAHVRSAILSCASEQRGGPRWWLGAAELCKALAAIGTPQASKALLDVLEANSRVFEFDGVRASAARCLGTFNDKGLVTRLVAASKLSNAPVLAIKEAIDKLGGEPLQSPEVIIEEGRSMEPEEAIRFFEIHQHAVDGWPKENQASFYYLFGLKIERLHGTDAAMPYYVAALLANPTPNAAAWLIFPKSPKTPEAAANLASKHPLPHERKSGTS